MSESVYILLCTCPAGEPAEALASELVARRLAACVNVLAGCKSIYRWQGEIQRDEESLLLIKSTGERLAALKAWVADHHPYDVPELLALPVATGLDPYLDWVRACVGEGEG